MIDSGVSFIISFVVISVGEPKRLCIYDRVKGKILKTVDSVYQAIDSREDCEDLCNTAPFR